MLSLKRDYGYIIGAIRAYEANDLKQNHIERMLSASTAQQAYEVLEDTLYSDVVSKHSNVKDFEKALSEHLGFIKKFLSDSVNNTDVLKILWQYYNCYNLRIALKAKIQGKDFDEIQGILSLQCSINLLTLKNAVFNDISDADLTPVIERALAAYEKTQDLRFIDFVCDQHCFTKIKEYSLKFNSELIENFFAAESDLHNVQVFLRATEEDRIKLKDYIFVNTGTVEVKNFTGSKEQAIYSISRILNVDTATIENKQDFSVLSKMSAQVSEDFITKSKYISDGPEAVVAFWWQEKRNVENIRILLVGKMNNIPNDKIINSLKKVV